MDDAAAAPVQSVPESNKRTKTKTTAPVKCRCKARRCTDCQLCIKCQCACNEPPRRPVQLIDGSTKMSPSNHWPKTTEGGSTYETVSARRRASRTNELDPPQSSMTTPKDEDAAAATSHNPSPKRPDNPKPVSEQSQASSGGTKVWAKLTCRCRARRCAVCTACSKCSCACNSDSKSPTSDKRKVDETPVTLPPSKKSKAAVSVKQSTLRRYPRQNTVPTIDIDSKESHSDAVRRRRSPRGGTSAKHKHEEAVNTAPNQIAKTDVLDDEAEATMSMDEETRKMDEELRAWMGKRSDEQEELTQLEKQIYELEGSYLRRSQHAGNIVKGYADANVFVAEMAKDEAQVDTPELEAAVQAQRLFSHSSTTSPAEPFKAAAEDAARDITETPAAK